MLQGLAMLNKEEIKKEWVRKLVKKHTIRKDGFIDYLQLGFDVVRILKDENTGTEKSTK